MIDRTLGPGQGVHREPASPRDLAVLFGLALQVLLSVRHAEARRVSVEEGLMPTTLFAMIGVLVAVLAAGCTTGRYTEDRQYVGDPERIPAASEPAPSEPARGADARPSDRPDRPNRP